MNETWNIEMPALLDANLMAASIDGVDVTLSAGGVAICGIFMLADASGQVNFVASLDSRRHLNGLQQNTTVSAIYFLDTQQCTFTSTVLQLGAAGRVIINRPRVILKSDKRAVPRASVDDGTTLLLDGYEYPVVDLSNTGLGVEFDGANPDIETGSRIAATLRLDDGTTMELMLKAVNRRELGVVEILGLFIEQINRADQERLTRFSMAKV